MLATSLLLAHTCTGLHLPDHPMTLLLLHLAATLFMTGLGWFVQVVHYPLMHRVGSRGFHAYETEHTRRTSPVVAPVMLFELVTGIWLVLQPPVGIDAALLLVNGLGLAVVWGSTFVLQVPLHRQLEQAFSAPALDRLVATNWVRTAAWSLRAVLLLVLVHGAVHQALPPQSTGTPVPAPSAVEVPQPPIKGVLLK